jgi:acetyl esterase
MTAALATLTGLTECTGQLSDPFVSPMHAANLRNLPPALVIAYGGDDPLWVEGEQYASRLRQDGVEARFLSI